MPNTQTREVLREPTLAEELEAYDEGLGEMANLREDRTGVPGVIFVSTRMGAHGPRVKWYEARPERISPSFSVSVADPPAVLASSVQARLLRQHAHVVVRWVALNREPLLEFWNEGAGLFEDERDVLLRRLRSIG